MFHVLAARGLRAFGDGFMSLAFPLYLLQLGMSALDVGILSTLTLAGSAGLSLAAGFLGRRVGYRRALIGAALLMAATGAGFAVVGDFWPLALVALAGTLNPSSGDASVFMPLEHAVLSGAAAARARTATFARYSLAGAVAGALGAMAAALPGKVAGATGMPLATAYQAAFAGYGLLGVACAALYAGLPRNGFGGRAQREDASALSASRRDDAPALSVSRRPVLLLAGLFAVDAFAGGFIVQSLLGLWLVARFGLGATALGALFLATGLLSGASYLAAAPLARRFGLVRTMVYTHVPSSVLLIGVALAPDVRLAVALLLARSLLSQIDVPTRSSYVMAVVTPPERAAAASVTGVPRSLAAAVGPLLAGWLLAASPFGWPLVIAGVLKIGYDLALLTAFGNVRPPEERDATMRACAPPFPSASPLPRSPRRSRSASSRRTPPSPSPR